MTHAPHTGKKTGSLAGHLLIATPVVQESCFERSVIFMCSHNQEGAMGVIVNYPVQDIGLNDVLEQLDIESAPSGIEFPIHFGGPVDAGRGFVVHSPDYASNDHLFKEGNIVVTASAAILHAVAEGKGPRQGILALGYAGWSPGQLEAEIEAGSWLVVPASAPLVFAPDNDTKWNLALASLGIDMGHLSSEVGHA